MLRFGRPGECSYSGIGCIDRILPRCIVGNSELVGRIALLAGMNLRQVETSQRMGYLGSSVVCVLQDYRPGRQDHLPRS